MLYGFSRRNFMKLSSASLLALGPFVPRAPSANGASPVSSVKGMPVFQRPRLRWWWPGGYIEPSQIEKEVRQMAAAGFGGFEIADVRDGVTVSMDPEIYGWGSPRWIAGVEQALETAVELDMKVDLTIGAHWPTGVPGVTPDDEAAAKEIVHGAAIVSGGDKYSGSLPQSGTVPAGVEQTGIPATVTPELIAVQAYKELRTNEQGVVLLESSSLIDLTDAVRGGSLEWTAPDNDVWHIIAYWMRGTGQLQNIFIRNRDLSMLATPTPYVVDIFGKAGAEACIDYWEGYLLPPRTRQLLARIGGNFFEDSLELSAIQHWSPELPREFATRRGYDIQPFLPLLTVKPETKIGLPFGPQTRPVPAYGFADVDTELFFHDFEKTLGEMYLDNRIRPLQDWANSLGMGFRVQCIGSSVDSGRAAAFATVPEGDNSCTMDAFRVLAAGRDIGGGKLLSSEAATFVGGQAHIADWKLLQFMVQRDFAGGVNQLVLHGHSYLDAPDAGWPGFSAFGRAIGNDWGPRSPLWTVAPDVSSYLANLQAILQKGKSVSDLAILHLGGGVEAELADMSLVYAGYSYQFFSEGLLDHPNVFVRDGKLAPDGPAYKALVIHNAKAMSLATAEKIVQLAAQGLPVLIVGQLPTDVPGLLGERKELEEIFSRLVKHKNAAQLNDLSEVVRWLKKRHVASSVKLSRKARIMPVRRRDTAGDYYYLLNDADAAVELSISLAGRGEPYLLDMCDGSTEPIVNYVRTGEYVEIPLKFLASEAKVIGLVKDGQVEVAHPKAHVVKGDGEWGVRNGGLCFKAFTPGRVIGQLSDGKRFALEVPGIRENVIPDQWSLHVDDWRPGEGRLETKHLSYELTLDALKPWSEIPELRKVSGIGSYRTIIPVEGGWRSDDGAVLDFGKVGGSCRVSINGKQLPPVNQMHPKVDVSNYLQQGRNLLEVTVATTLNNRLLAEGITSNFDIRPEEESVGEEEPANSSSPLDPPTGRQFGAPVQQSGPMSFLPGAGVPGGQRTEKEYGLIGPVVLQFYKLVPVQD
ncbi:hypothetical protein FIV46_07785 [Emcibacter nanhaiensis]|uniref:Alpha-L-rhamnosidase n=1 Tax=Emcibacter nanhaiensis TaxID=1505037 RepID=A0A501PJC6_9PROT|nr:hypothetical protein FIV46_07785 [Emcibacter nanhaiensis]